VGDDLMADGVVAAVVLAEVADQRFGQDEPHPPRAVGDRARLDDVVGDGGGHGHIDVNGAADVLRRRRPVECDRPVPPHKAGRVGDRLSM
jgi:hypothetical protein